MIDDKIILDVLDRSLNQDHSMASASHSILDTDTLSSCIEATVIDKHIPTVWTMRTRANGRYEITVTKGGNIRIWNISQGCAVPAVEGPPLGFHLGSSYYTGNEIISRHMYPVDDDRDYISVSHINGHKNDFRFSNITKSDTATPCGAVPMVSTTM